MTNGVLCFGMGIFSYGNLSHRRRILEVGSLNVNGSLRDCIESQKPFEYIGVDIKSGPGVDIVCDATKLDDTFLPESFDGVVCTEVIEHIKEYGRVLDGIRRVLKTGGWLFLSAPAPGFPKHDYPEDYHRFTTQTLMDEIKSRFFSVVSFAHTVDNEAVVFGIKKSNCSEVTQLAGHSKATADVQRVA